MQKRVLMPINAPVDIYQASVIYSPKLGSIPVNAQADIASEGPLFPGAPKDMHLVEYNGMKGYTAAAKVGDYVLVDVPVPQTPTPDAFKDVKGEPLPPFANQANPPAPANTLLPPLATSTGKGQPQPEPATSSSNLSKNLPMIIGAAIVSIALLWIFIKLMSKKS